jgi:hypothetical protein
LSEGRAAFRIAEWFSLPNGAAGLLGDACPRVGHVKAGVDAVDHPQFWIYAQRI